MTERPSFKWVAGIGVVIISGLMSYLFSSLAAADDNLGRRIDRHDDILSDKSARLAALEASMSAQEKRLTSIEVGVDRVSAKIDRLLEKK